MKDKGVEDIPDRQIANTKKVDLKKVIGITRGDIMNALKAHVDWVVMQSKIIFEDKVGHDGELMLVLNNIEKSGNLNSISSSGKTLLHFCIKYNEFDFFDFLLKDNLIDPNIGNPCPLIYASKLLMNNYILRILDNPKIDVSITDEYRITAYEYITLRRVIPASGEGMGSVLFESEAAQKIRNHRTFRKK